MRTRLTEPKCLIWYSYSKFAVLAVHVTVFFHYFHVTYEIPDSSTFLVYVEKLGGAKFVGHSFSHLCTYTYFVCSTLYKSILGQHLDPRGSSCLKLQVKVKQWHICTAVATFKVVLLLLGQNTSQTPSGSGHLAGAKIKNASDMD